MSAELCENVFDVIIYSSRAYVELEGNCSCAVARRQTFQDFLFTRSECCLGHRKGSPGITAGMGPHKFVHGLLQSLPHFARTHDVNSMLHSGGIARNYRRQITPLLPDFCLHSQIKISVQMIGLRSVLNDAMLGTKYSVVIAALEQLMTSNANRICFTDSEELHRSTVPGSDSSGTVHGKGRVCCTFDQNIKLLITHACSLDQKMTKAGYKNEPNGLLT